MTPAGLGREVDKEEGGVEGLRHVRGGRGRRGVGEGDDKRLRGRNKEGGDGEIAEGEIREIDEMGRNRFSKHGTKHRLLNIAAWSDNSDEDADEENDGSIEEREGSERGMGENERGSISSLFPDPSSLPHPLSYPHPHPLPHPLSGHRPMSAPSQLRDAAHTTHSSRAIKCDEDYDEDYDADFVGDDDDGGGGGEDGGENGDEDGENGREDVMHLINRFHNSRNNNDGNNNNYIINNNPTTNNDSIRHDASTINDASIKYNASINSSLRVHSAPPSRRPPNPSHPSHPSLPCSPSKIDNDGEEQRYYNGENTREKGNQKENRKEKQKQKNQNSTLEKVEKERKKIKEKEKEWNNRTIPSVRLGEKVLTYVRFNNINSAYGVQNSSDRQGMITSPFMAVRNGGENPFDDPNSGTPVLSLVTRREVLTAEVTVCPAGTYRPCNISLCDHLMR